MYGRAESRDRKIAPHRANSRSHMRSANAKETDGRGGSVQERAGVKEPRRVQRDRRSAADPIGHADHVVLRSRCSRRGRQESTSRSHERPSGRFSSSVRSRPSVSTASLRDPGSLRDTRNFAGVPGKISWKLADSSPL